MKLLVPEEAELIGGVVVVDGRLERDPITKRIDYLVSNVLEHIGESNDNGGWDVLYRDPNDGRLWEKYYPKAEYHGGGPPALRCIEQDEARKRYDRSNS